MVLDGGQLLELTHWICTWGEYNNDRDLIVGIAEGLSHVEGRWHDEAGSELLLFLDELLDDLDDLISSEDSQEH